MFKALRNLLADFGGDSQTRHFREDDHRLAAAALLYHVIAVDGSVDESERVRLHGLLKSLYALDDEETDELVRDAETADQEAVDLYRFTSLLKDRLELAERERVVAMMWDLVYRDGELHEFEDNAIWRVADLLGISNRDRIRLKQDVRSQAVKDA
ncbi:hypothetical protein C3941_13795 [Kaistia algarum]|uniref:tellurite resistance TerB family protein n=1 Tax=Kaistia algarum TaxID=2083279 RepID=UPI000CE7CD70|nr:TerB family tellurite resistance protein [Kaistia algarum]MCX5513711.1 TerB family tellurite resistance protein [Kaistia algarum]PPE79416.1 hypothetical protein C3941_13795 [Kaistia algarum]